MEMSEKQIEQFKKSIQEYTDYLNNGQQKPAWRIEEVESYIKVLTKIINNKGIENGKDGRTD